MIERPQYFRESHIPQTLPHRQDELQRIATTLEPALKGDTPDDILLSGPSGVGKTVVATKAVRKLHERAGVRTAHLRCLGRSAGAIIQEAVEEHPRSPREDIGQTTPVEQKAAALDDVADAYLLVLDEADDVHKTDLFAHLADIEGVSYVAICHNPQEWMPSLPRAASRRLYTHIEFDRYSVPALTEILAQRARRGLAGDAIDQRTLEAIAERVGGVARLGIQTLFQAAQLAEADRRDQIERADVSPALEQAREAVRRSNLRSLPIGHLLVYHVIQQAGEIDAPDFHSRYDAIADDALAGRAKETPASNQTRRRYLDKLAEYDLVGWHGEKKGRTYFAMDPDLEIPENSGLSLPQPASR
jgi:Cdc6-like AAA superfamily ATPase